jgi:hypothetical protein
MTAGRLAALAWMRARALTPPTLTPWHVEVSLDVRNAPAIREFDEHRDTRFHVEIYSEEWGVFFCHEGHASWIRVTDVPFVHGRDDFNLLSILPPLKDVGGLVRALERQHSIQFRREFALVRTNVPSAQAVVQAWVRTL